MTTNTTIAPELLDQLLANYEKPEDLTGEDGLFKQLKRALIERALDGAGRGGKLNAEWALVGLTHNCHSVAHLSLGTCSPTGSISNGTLCRFARSTWAPAASPWACSAA